MNSRRLALAAQGSAFRAAIATLCLLAQLWLMTSFARDRYGIPFNTSPGAPPSFVHPGAEQIASHWNRLVVSRWDSSHYISLVLRGYSQCPRQDVLKTGIPGFCNLNFYPGYSLIGKGVRAITGLPADYALLAVSLAASLVFLFLWTDPAIVRALGVGATYTSLAAFNAFPNAFALVTTQTEPCTFAFTLGAFLAFAKRRIWLAALLAGAATGMRVTGIAVGAAMALAIVVQAFVDRPERVVDWLRPFLAALVANWGILAMTGYHWWWFGDPLLYPHAHERGLAHSASLMNLLHPRTEWLLRSIDQPLHEGVVLAFAVVWFVLGHRQALGRFSASEQVFWYGLTALGTGVALVGSLDLALAGFNRYLLLLFPVFYSMGCVMKSRPLLLAFWLAVSFWHCKQADLCGYLGGLEMGFSRCYR